MLDCLIEKSNFLFALVQSQNATLPTISSELAVINSVMTVIISGLNIKSIYNITIISNNSLGIAFSEFQQFCKFMKNCYHKFIACTYLHINYIQMTLKVLTIAIQ